MTNPSTRRWPPENEIYENLKSRRSGCQRPSTCGGLHPSKSWCRRPTRTVAWSCRGHGAAILRHGWQCIDSQRWVCVLPYLARFSYDPMSPSSITKDLRHGQGVFSCGTPMKIRMGKTTWSFSVPTRRCQRPKLRFPGQRGQQGFETFQVVSSSIPMWLGKTIGQKVSSRYDRWRTKTGASGSRMNAMQAAILNLESPPSCAAVLIVGRPPPHGRAPIAGAAQQPSWGASEAFWQRTDLPAHAYLAHLLPPCVDPRGVRMRCCLDRQATSVFGWLCTPMCRIHCVPLSDEFSHPRFTYSLYLAPPAGSPSTTRTTLRGHKDTWRGPMAPAQFSNQQPGRNHGSRLWWHLPTSYRHTTMTPCIPCKCNVLTTGGHHSAYVVTPTKPLGQAADECHGFFCGMTIARCLRECSIPTPTSD